MVNVGIFWFIRDRVYGKVEHLSGGNPSSVGKIDSTLEHWHLWETPGALQGISDLVTHHEYWEFPRGRVVYDTARSYYLIYADRALLKPDIKIRVVDFFGLSHKKVAWFTDTHYVTEPEEIRRLLGE